MDAAQLKRICHSRWPEILSNIGSIPIAHLTGSNREHSCPKCGGTTRFRMIDIECGAVFCNQCFRKKSGDGISAVQWLLGGCDMPTAINKILEYLRMDKDGVNVAAGGTSKKTANTSASVVVKSKSVDKKTATSTTVNKTKAKQQFKPTQWNNSHAAIWCLKKKPIKPAALQLYRAELGYFGTEFNSDLVIAFPIFSPALAGNDSKASPQQVGTIVYPANGAASLPRFERDDKTNQFKIAEYLKCKLTAGSSASGWCGMVDRIATDPTSPNHNIKSRSAIETVWITEGATDGLALATMLHHSTLAESEKAKHCILSNVHGAGTMPIKSMVDALARSDAALPNIKRIVVVYDNEESGTGQRGAIGYHQDNDITKPFIPGCCHYYAKSAEVSTNGVGATIYNLLLSLPPGKTKIDLRDYIFSRLPPSALAMTNGQPSPTLAEHATDAFNHLVSLIDIDGQVIEPHPAAQFSARDGMNCDSVDGSGSTSNSFNQSATGNTDSDTTTTTKTIIQIPIDNPHRLARLNLEFYKSSHTRDLRYWKESWFSYSAGRYEEITADHFRSRLTAFIQQEFERACAAETDSYNEWLASPKFDEKKDKGPPKLRPVTKTIVDNAYQATKSICLLRNSQELDMWIDVDVQSKLASHPAATINAPTTMLDTATNITITHHFNTDTFISLQNGILNLSALIRWINESQANPAITESHTSKTQSSIFLIPHTSNWFSKIKLSYSFDLTATPTRWLQFVREVFDNDEESIDIFQKWFGYLLSGANNLHKILFVIGVKRSGKGTCQAIIKDLFGKENICTPTLSDLANQFVLEGMIGKSVGMITDARLSARADEVSITEMLLAITGGDQRDIKRKFKSTITDEVRVRFTLFSNLIPRFKDPSNVFSSRCIFLFMPKSFLGKEDYDLLDNLRQELSGILNWALLGKLKIDRAIAAKQPVLTQPRKSVHLVHELGAIMAPISQFIDQECVVGHGLQISTKVLFEFWKQWCEENDNVDSIGTIQTFGRRIKAVSPLVDTQQVRSQGDWTNRQRMFINITARKNSDGDFFSDTNTDNSNEI